MSFLETVERARTFLERHRRVSLRALRREFDLDPETLAELSDELVQVQHVAVLEGDVLVWTGEGLPSPERDPRAYTPKHLAEKILTSRAALEGERKQVTVLFADVKGSMELAEQLDPEEWHKIMDGFFQLLAEGVHRFEGTVNQFSGDGIMALFGAPIAHEDHAQRACWAALHLRDEVRRYADELRRTRGLNFSVRMGLNSGEVVVGRIGDDLRMDYTAQGHTVGLAQRMEQLAEAGRIYLTEYTAALVGGFFQLEDLGPFTVKGMRDPLRIYALGGFGPLQTRLDVSRTRGFSRFVGRTDEVAVLEAALARAEAGQAQIVGVVGEAGLGKSRLCYEFLQRCRARGLMTYEAHGVAHGQAVPCLPVLQLVRAFFGITEHDSAVTARERIAGRLLLLGERFRDTLPVVFDFLGVPDAEHAAPPMDPEIRQRQLLAVVREVVQARGQREATVTLLEDLHWFDPASEAFLEPLVEARPGTRGLLVLNFRPEYHAAWMQKSYYHQLPLLPLGAEAMRELLADRLGDDASVATLADLIHARTGGNPFFGEEMVQALIDGGTLVGSRGCYRMTAPVAAIDEVPATVQALLAARIDRLPEREKDVLQTAAVIGKEFSESVLARVVDRPAPEVAAALAALVGREFLYEAALYPEAEYAFRHPLTQEVAYRSQLGERRRAMHAAVAGVLVELAPEQREERAALIAHHWEQAGDAFEAARWHDRAARWILRRDFVEAIRHWQKSRALLAVVPESEEVLRLGLAIRRRILAHAYWTGIADEEARAVLEEGNSLAARLNDRRAPILLRWGYSECRAMKGWAGEHRECLLEIAQQAAQVGDDELAYALRVALVLASVNTGDLRDVERLAAPILDRQPPDPTYGTRYVGSSTLALVCQFSGVSLAEQGRLAEAQSHLERGLRSFTEFSGLQVAVTAFHRAHVRLAYLRGDAAGAMANARVAVQAAESAEAPRPLAWARHAVALAHLVGRDWEAAVRAFEESIAFAREHGVLGDQEAGQLASLAEAQLGLGDVEAARTSAEAALALARERGAHTVELDAQVARAGALLASPGAIGPAIAALAAAEALIEQTGAESRRPLIHLARAELARLAGDEDRRQRELGEARRLYIEMGAPMRAEQVAMQLGP